MASITDAVPAGVVVYNVGEHHAAHDAWEAVWLALDAGSDDERFLHGLIQFTAAVYHSRRQNWSGARKLAVSAMGYLDGLGPEHRGVDLTRPRSYLGRLGADPEYAERARPPSLRYEGAVIEPIDLSLDALAVAADVVAEEYGYDEQVIDHAVRYAREERHTARSRFITLLFDFVEVKARRDLVYTRLRDHVDRARREERDVEGLFE